MFDLTLGTAQGFLALFFLAAGLPKVIGRGIERWVGFDDLPRGLTIVIGAAEVAAAVGLVGPRLLGHGQWTTPLASIGIAVVSLMASGFHIRNGEWLAALETALWASLAASVAISRWGLLSTGPSVSKNVLVPVLLVLLPGIVVNLVVLTRTTAPSSSGCPAPSPCRRCGSPSKPAGRAPR
ncbi:DoxX family protein [Streptomyces hygroscopicus]|uniref:DoxX family protein n=1 Tax=Streptomyces hygroscopicus TaxID=1912 RepID=UPI00223ECD34|nr:DoxX family protein [Streptomyces hygroscopicus]